MIASGNRERLRPLHYNARHSTARRAWPLFDKPPRVVSMSKLDSLFTAALEQAARRQVRRRLRRAAAAPPGRLALDGRTLVNFSSNDYLGLARHPLLAERASLWATRHGAGAQASRLVCGNLDLHRSEERRVGKGCRSRTVRI